MDSMSGKRRLNYSPSGHTPQSKRSNPSGKKCKLLQVSLQDEIRDKFEVNAKSRMWLLEVKGALECQQGTNSIVHAMKVVFDNVTYKRGTFHGIALSGPLATPIEVDLQKDEVYQCPCDCVGNVSRIIKEELDKLAQKDTPSLLRCSANDLSQLTTDDLQKEFKTRTPVLYKLITQSLEGKSRKSAEKKMPAIIALFCKMANIYNVSLNAYQKLMGLSLRSSGTSKRMINKLSHLHDSVSYTTLTSILDGFAAECKRMMATWSDKTVIHAGDNLDIRTKARYEGKGVSCHELHLYNNMVYLPRIDVEHLSDEIPVVQLEGLDYSQFLLSKEEESHLSKLMLYQVKKSWQMTISLSIQIEEPEHRYAAQMMHKTQKLHAGVIDKNEAKTGEMLDILRYCSEFPSPDHAHKMPYRGDVGTYKVAKKALSISDESLPFVPCIGAFHLQMEWTQLIFDQFFDESCNRDPEGLAAMKVALNSKQVKSDVRKNYYAAEHFLDKVLDSLLLEAANRKLAGQCSQEAQFARAQAVAEELVTDIYSQKRSMKFPSDKCPHCLKAYKNYTTLKRHIIKEHSESFAVEGLLHSSTDGVLSHTHQLLKLLLIKRCLDYAVNTGNGDVLTLLMKHMVLYFRQLGYKNYSLACVEHVAQVQVFLSDRTKELVKHECFVNNRGRKGTNLPMDLDLEHQNRFFKENFVLKSNLPSPSILNRLSLAQDMLEKTLTNFEVQFKIHRHTAIRRENEERYLSDVKRLSGYLHSRNLFEMQPGRAPHSSKLKTAAHDPLLLVDMFELKQWLQKSIQRMMDQQFLQ